MWKDRIHEFDFKDQEKDGHRFAGHEIQQSLIAIRDVLDSFKNPDELSPESRLMYNAMLGDSCYAVLPDKVREFLDMAKEFQEQRVVVLKGMIPTEGRGASDRKKDGPETIIGDRINRAHDALHGIFKAESTGAFTASPDYGGFLKVPSKRVKEMTGRPLENQLGAINLSGNEYAYVTDKGGVEVININDGTTRTLFEHGNIPVAQDDRIHSHPSDFAFLISRFGNKEANLNFFFDEHILELVAELLTGVSDAKRYQDAVARALESGEFHRWKGNNDSEHKVHATVLENPSYSLALSQGDVVIFTGSIPHNRDAFISKGNPKVERLARVIFATHEPDKYEFTEQELESARKRFTRQSPTPSR